MAVIERAASAKGLGQRCQLGRDKSGPAQATLATGHAMGRTLGACAVPKAPSRNTINRAPHIACQLVVFSIFTTLLKRTFSSRTNLNPGCTSTCQNNLLQGYVTDPTPWTDKRDRCQDPVFLAEHTFLRTPQMRADHDRRNLGGNACPEWSAGRRECAHRS